MKKVKWSKMSLAFGKGVSVPSKEDYKKSMYFDEEELSSYALVDGKVFGKLEGKRGVVELLLENDDVVYVKTDCPENKFKLERFLRKVPHLKPFLGKAFSLKEAMAVIESYRVLSESNPSLELELPVFSDCYGRMVW